MTIQSLPLSSILPPEGNPRTAIDPAGIESLAASIQADGLLQNLVVLQLKGRKPRYRLISGERRYQALKLLEERGALPEDYAVPVDIRSGLSADDGLRLATVENVQRENLTPLEEASAFARLMQEGLPLEELTAQTGLSASTIKRRLALASLCDEVKEALINGELTLAQAEALTLGSHEAQCDIVQRLADGYRYGVEDIRDMLLEQRPSVALARFPLEQYQGTYTTDLFGEDATTYFDDVEQFFTLHGRRSRPSPKSMRRKRSGWRSPSITPFHAGTIARPKTAPPAAWSSTSLPPVQSKCSKDWTTTPSPPARPRRPPTPPSPQT